MEIILLICFIAGWVLSSYGNNDDNNKDLDNSLNDEIVYPLVMWEVFDGKDK